LSKAAAGGYRNQQKNQSNKMTLPLLAIVVFATGDWFPIDATSVEPIDLMLLIGENPCKGWFSHLFTCDGLMKWQNQCRCALLLWSTYCSRTLVAVILIR
jgi:hypothetical protein